MADREELLRLASLCEAASGPDRELDGWIEWHLRPQNDRWALREDMAAVIANLDQFEDLRASVPAYTASLDAAMTLVPADCVWGVGNSDDPSPAVFRGTVMPPRGTFTSHGATPALALAAASLRARAQDPLRAHGGGE